MALVLAAFLGALALQAKTKKGDQFFKQGEAAELKNDWDTAVTMYQKAFDADPKDLAYEIAMRRARFQDGQMHVDKGVKLRNDDKLQEAMQEFQKALIADPSSSVALQEIKRTQQMLQQGSAADTKGLTATEKMRREEDVRVASIEAPPELKPTIRKFDGPFKMNNSPPTQLFRTVAMRAGLYVTFDPAGLASNKPLDVNLDDMTPEEAFDYLAFVTHTFWKPISANTIFVCDDNTQKRRDYQSEVVRVFYMPNAYTVQEFQEIANALRTVAEIRRVFTYNAGRAMVVRGTPDEISLVEKLVHDLDKPKAEVIVDVMILQVGSTVSKQLAATIASGGTAGLNVPIAFSPTSAITTAASSTSTTTSTTAATTTTPTTTAAGTTGSSIGLNSLAHLSSADFSTSLPGALLQAMLTDTKTKVLNSPQVRASDGMKVELKVGLRIPYATGSLGSAVGATTVGVSPLVQTQFSYADTGITLIIQPTVHSADELTMHVEITVASVQQYTLIGGISQPVIQQEVNQTDVRMKNGEVSLLGGLNQTTDASTVNGIPGLTNIPVLGKLLFGSQSTEKDSNQILISIKPHIIRTPDYGPENMRTIFAGSDQNIRVLHAQAPDVAPAPPAAAKPQASTSPAAAGPAAAVSPDAAVTAVTARTLPATPAAPPPGQPTPNQPASNQLTPAQPAPNQLTPAQPAPTAIPAAAGPAPAVAPANGVVRLSFLPGPVQVAQNGSFTLTVQLEGAADLFSISPLQLKFDPAQVRLNDASAGDLMTRDGVRVTKAQDIRNDAGEATLTLTRLPGATGVSGSGALATLSFSAVGKGSGTVAITGASLKNSQLQPSPAALASVPVTVQ